MTENMLSLFKGFIPTNNKKPKQGFLLKDASTWLSYEEVKNLPEFAGILADDTVLVDIDDSEQAEIMMQIVEEKQIDVAVNQTTRGKHFFGKNNGLFNTCPTHIKLACNLEADIKIGCKNAYAILKFDGQERFTEWDIEDDGQYQKIPMWMLPVKSSADFINMEEGDGRDSALYGYILNLQSAGLSKDEIRECIQIINEHLLKDKMTDTDIERITRDEAFKTDFFFVDGRFQHDKFAQFIKSEYHIKRINGQLHVYRNGIYVPGQRYIENMMIQSIPTLKMNQRNEVLKYLEVLIPDNEVVSAYENMIAFENGVYDRKNDVLLPFSPQYVITNLIPWNYNKHAYDELTDKTLNRLSCNDSEIRALLEEVIGYCFYRKNSLQKSFILTGSGSNGKSTYLETLKVLLGEINISQLDIGELDDRFNTIMMSGKLANIGDDISSDYLEGKTLAVFKKVVTGNGLKGEQKGMDVVFFKPTIKLIFSSNDIPKMKSKGFDAIKRRLLIIPFNAKFSKDDPDYDNEIEEKLKTDAAMEYLIQLGLQGLDRALRNKGFTESSKVQKEVEEFAKENDPMLSWLDSLEDESFLINEGIQDIYMNYSVYCEQSGFKPLAVNIFSKDLQTLKNLEVYRKTVNRKTFKMYRKIC